MELSEIFEFIYTNFITLFFVSLFSTKVFIFFVGKIISNKKLIICALIYALTTSIPASIMTEIGSDGFMTDESLFKIFIFALIVDVFYYLYLNQGFSLRGLSGYFTLNIVISCFSDIPSFFIFYIMGELDLEPPIPYILAYHIIAPILYILFIKLLNKVDVLPLIDSLFADKRTAFFSTIGFILFSSLGDISEFLAPKFAEAYPFAFGILIISLLIVLMVFSAFYKNARIRISEQESILLQQENYVKTLESIQKEMRTLQHDYKNILSGIYLQSTEGRTDEIQHYLEKTLGQIDQNVSTKIKQTTHLSNIKISEIKSIILTKLLQMEQLGINFNLEIDSPIETINMDTTNFVRCLGILIDNAIEEIQQISDETAKIDLVLSKEKNDVTLIVKNPTRSKAKLHQIWQEGFSTKGVERGLGLFSYQRILQNYPHVSKQTIADENEFMQILTIRN